MPQSDESKSQNGEVVGNGSAAPSSPLATDADILFISMMKHILGTYYAALGLDRTPVHHVRDIRIALKQSGTPISRTRLVNAIGHDRDDSHTHQWTAISLNTRSILIKWICGKLQWLPSDCFDCTTLYNFEFHIANAAPINHKSTDQSVIDLIACFNYLCSTCAYQLNFTRAAIDTFISSISIDTNINEDHICNLLGLTPNPFITPPILAHRLKQWFIVRLPWVTFSSFDIAPHLFKQEIIRLKYDMDSSNITDNIILPVRYHQPYLDIMLPIPHRFYIGYRYAFESPYGDRLIARDFVSIVPNDRRFDFSITYRKYSQLQSGRTFHSCTGSAFQIGHSLTCIGIDQSKFGPAEDRIRVFLTRAIEPNRVSGCRFGILSSTRIELDYEACSTCLILFPIQFKFEDLSENMRLDYKERVTVIRPLDAILKHDFSDLPKPLQEILEHMLSNIPRGIDPKDPHPENKHSSETSVTNEKNSESSEYLEKVEDDLVPEKVEGDLVLRLHHFRFVGHISKILDHVNASAHIKSPIKSNWSKNELLEPRY